MIGDATHEAIDDAVYDAEAATLDMVYAAVDATRDAIDRAASSAVDSATHDAVEAATITATYAATRIATSSATASAARDATYDSTRAAAEAAARLAATRARTRAIVAATVDETETTIYHAAIVSFDNEVATETCDTVSDVAYAQVEAAADLATSAFTLGALDALASAAAFDAEFDPPIVTADVDVTNPWYTPVADSMCVLASKLGGSDAEIYLGAASSCFNFRNGGNQWSGYVAHLSFFRHVVGLGESHGVDYSKWHHYEQAAIHAGPRYMHREFCIVSDRPEVLTVDEQNRPHNDSGPFCRWRDGISLYSIHGVRVPQYVVERPDAITIDLIHAEGNEEVRRVMIERYGLARYVRDAQFVVLDEDRDPLGQPRRLLRREDIVVIELTNSTEDADGTRRVYHVPCHPELRPLLPDGELGEPQEMTALAAVASTYGLRAEQYVLEVET